MQGQQPCFHTSKTFPLHVSHLRQSIIIVLQKRNENEDINLEVTCYHALKVVIVVVRKRLGSCSSQFLVVLSLSGFVDSGFRRLKRRCFCEMKLVITTEFAGKP